MRPYILCRRSPVAIQDGIFNQRVDKVPAGLLKFNQMVEEAIRMDAVFQALSHRTRRDMLSRLAVNDLTVGELAEPLTMSLEAASKHIRVLERAGLVGRTIEGRRHLCRLEAAPLESAANWLAFYQRFWTERLDGLQAMFDKSSAPKTHRTPTRRKK
jgi:DNA-binding transcriptional ArsR family regulator